MIQEIKIKNFLSFKDEVTFSFLASEDKFAEESQVVQIDENTRLLRFAVIYGYNASGKSNLITAVFHLLLFWRYRPVDLNSGTQIIPFKLDETSYKEPTEFELTFFSEKIKYLYQLKLDRDKVLFEKLSYFKGNQPTMLFERRFENNQSVIDFNNGEDGDSINETAKNELIVKCWKNISFFAARGQVNVNLPLIDNAFKWSSEHCLMPILPQYDLTDIAEGIISENNEASEHILDFLSEADFNITGINSEKFDENKGFKTTFEHTIENASSKETYYLNKIEESLGTLRTFGLETIIFKAKEDNSFLMIDEIETSLHNKLLEKILFDFLRADSTSQLLVTTHNDSLLELVDDLIRKDSVYFIEKDKAGASDLYKLTDFKGIDKLSSIREAYRYKRFGATMK
jgi:AAA15 family ATPase/GTPase